MFYLYIPTIFCFRYVHENSRGYISFTNDDHPLSLSCQMNTLFCILALLEFDTTLRACEATI